jgi:uncharacterized metal-binding protein YceD (DUF177 family)
MDKSAGPEFSRPLDVQRIRREEEMFEIAAKPAERAALASRFGLQALDRLAAVVRVQRIPGGLIRLQAELDADVAQACVLTLEPVPAKLAESFTLLYSEDRERSEVTLDGAAEPVEPVVDGVIDMGEAVAQQLSLALDPFPRAPNAPQPSLETAPEAPPAPTNSPFQALAALRSKNDSKG